MFIIRQKRYNNFYLLGGLKLSLVFTVLFSFFSFCTHAQDDDIGFLDEEHVSIYKTSYDDITSQEKLNFQDSAYEYVLNIQDDGVEALLNSEGSDKYTEGVEASKGLAESMTDSIAEAYGTAGPYLKALGGLLARFLGNIDASTLGEILTVVKYLMFAFGVMFMGKAFLQAIAYAFTSTAGTPLAFLYATWGFLSTPNMFNMTSQFARGVVNNVANTWGAVARTSWLFFGMMNMTNNLRYHYHYQIIHILNI